MKAEMSNWIKVGVVTGTILVYGLGMNRAQADIILEYKFNETGTTVACSTGADKTALTMRAADGKETDLHGAAGSGLTGTANDRAFDNTATVVLGNAGTGGGRADQADSSAINRLNSLTLQGWYKIPAISNGARLFENGSGGEGFKLFFYGKSYLIFGHGVSKGSVADTCPVPYKDVNTWVFFAVTYDGTSGTVKFYKGLKDSAVTLIHTVHSKHAGVLTKNTTGLAIGNIVGNNRPFSGLMDNFRIYGSQMDSSGALSLDRLEEIRKMDIME